MGSRVTTNVYPCFLNGVCAPFAPALRRRERERDLGDKEKMFWLFFGELVRSSIFHRAATIRHLFQVKPHVSLFIVQRAQVLPGAFGGQRLAAYPDAELARSSEDFEEVRLSHMVERLVSDPGNLIYEGAGSFVVAHHLGGGGSASAIVD